jgi:STE24 endopeptidase
MGHYVLGHASQFLVFFALVVLAGFAILRRVFAWAVGRWGARWGVRGIDDPAGLPLLALVLSVYLTLLTPVLNTEIRTAEAAADAFGLNAARQPDGFARIAVKLADYRKLDPGPLEELLLFDHPSGRSRIRMAMRWKAAMLDTLAEP